MPIAFALAAAAAGIPLGEYRCVAGDRDHRLRLRPDYSYVWDGDPAAGTWRWDKRERVFLIATGPLALRDPRDGRYAAGRLTLTLGTGERWTCRIGTPPAR